MKEIILECEKRDFSSEGVSKNRALERYVWYQVRNMIKNDLQLGRILQIDENGILLVNDKTRLLTDEQKKYVNRLIGNLRDGIYRNHQFEDLDKGLKSKEKYNKWFDEEAMNSFMQTIPTKEIFYTYPVTLYYGKLRNSHSSDELNRQDFSGYSVWQTMYALDIISPFLVGILLGGEVKVEIDNPMDYNTYIGFNYNGKRLYGKHNSIELFEKDANGNFIKLDDTIHTLLFRHYQEPIYTTLNSLMYPIGGYRVMPSEGFQDDPRIPELTSETTTILKSENYKTLARNYHLGHSRISSRGY